MRETIKAARTFWLHQLGTDGFLENWVRSHKLRQTIKLNNVYETLARLCFMAVEQLACGTRALTVKGIVGLGVVDDSIFPYIPAAHTQASTYIVAECAADLIKQSWALANSK